MSIQKQSQIILDMEKGLKGLEYIDEVRVVREEKIKATEHCMQKI
ncbi:hypothetical protein ACLMAB_17195 [Brevibacillus laterosporus]